MYNSFELSAASVGILLEGAEGDYTQNAIAALNTIRGAQTGVKAEWMFNSVILLNQAVSVEAHSNKNLYIIENNLGGRIVAKNNNYIIADCNCTGEETVQSGNENTNGNTNGNGNGNTNGNTNSANNGNTRRIPLP